MRSLRTSSIRRKIFVRLLLIAAFISSSWRDAKSYKKETIAIGISTIIGSLVPLQHSLTCQTYTLILPQHISARLSIGRGLQIAFYLDRVTPFNDTEVVLDYAAIVSLPAAKRWIIQGVKFILLLFNQILLADAYSSCRLIL